MTSPRIQTIPFETDQGLGQSARIGMIILQTDQSIEFEVSQILYPSGPKAEIALYHSRIPNHSIVDQDSLQQMSEELPQASALLPNEFEFDAIGYGCTSGATIIGEARVDQLIKTAHPHAQTTNPITACKAALRALGLRKIALVTPYGVDVTKAMQETLEASNIAISAVATFNMTDDFTVARIAKKAIKDAVLAIGKEPDCEAVFVSCTSLRALPIIAETEALLAKPVLSSNLVFTWHLMQLCGLEAGPENKGFLFESAMRV